MTRPEKKRGLKNWVTEGKKLCENFAKKAAKSEKFQNWFSPTENVENNCSKSTRRNKNKTVPLFRPIPTRTSRYKKSPLPYLTEILNEAWVEEHRSMYRCIECKLWIIANQAYCRTNSLVKQIIVSKSVLLAHHF